MNSILIGSLLISLLHALIPNHWLPILAIGRKQHWSLPEIMRVTLLSGLAHILSTIGIGIILGMIGSELSESIEQFTKIIAPSILILLGFYFIRQHYQHHHFHVNDKKIATKSKGKIIAALFIAMFLSPCMEIEAYFLLAGTKGWWFLSGIAGMYAFITLTGMLLWVRFAFNGLIKLNWHSLEHNAGIITGSILVITGILSFYFT
jgi:nickel/cobalt transporter (NicO) family protein